MNILTNISTCTNNCINIFYTTLDRFTIEINKISNITAIYIRNINKYELSPESSKNLKRNVLYCHKSNRIPTSKFYMYTDNLLYLRLTVLAP